MKELHSLSLKSSIKGLFVLDQTKLPQAEEWIEISDVETMVKVVKDLRVRGAPLIGIASALCLGHLSRREANVERLRQAARTLRQARPTAVNLMNNIDSMLKVLDETGSGDGLMDRAEELFFEDVRLCENIARNGAHFIQENGAVLTHCNTGGLATAGEGTALAIIKAAHRQGKRFEVLVDETRPLLQGGRLTTWELRRAGIPHTLICDNMAAMLMARGRVQCVIVGADRIATNGDFANKVGTYSLAVNSHYHRLPFYVAAPTTTVDRNCHSGAEIPIEQRASAEVTGVKGSFGEVVWAPVDTPCFNPAFDVTPANLVERWILDTSAYDKAAVLGGVLGKGN